VESGHFDIPAAPSCGSPHVSCDDAEHVAFNRVAMNCHLLVPDLLHAARTGTALYDGLALPALETLLARGGQSGLAAAPRDRWLAATSRIAAGHDLPLAALSLSSHGVDPGNACWLQA